MTTTATSADQETLDQRVRGEVNALRGRFNISQAVLGRVIGVTQTQMSQRLRGDLEFKLVEIEKIARFFGTTPGYLLGYENAPRPKGPGGGLGYTARDLNPEPADSLLAQVVGWIGRGTRELVAA
jgi:transcriptional regulator with XRE-family HTH domain